MANNANNFNIWNGGNCGCGDRVTECNTIFQKVDTLPSTGDATRNHAYVLPDNTVWTLNSNGTAFVQLNGADAEQKQQLEAIQNLLGSKITLKADNLPAVEAGLGDVFEVDFTNLDTTFEGNKLTIKQTGGSEQSVQSKRQLITYEGSNPKDGVLYATVEKMGTDSILINYQFAVPVIPFQEAVELDVSDLVNDLAKSMVGDEYRISNLPLGKTFILQGEFYEGGKIMAYAALTFEGAFGDYTVKFSTINENSQDADVLFNGQVILKIESLG